MIISALPNVFLFWWVCLLMKGLLLHISWLSIGMVPLGICLKICYNILNFRLCTVWLSLVFLIAQIRKLKIVVFLSFYTHSICDWVKSFGLILFPLLRLWCFGSFCVGICLLIWMLKKMCWLYIFRDSRCEYVDSFSVFLRISNALYIKVMVLFLLLNMHNWRVLKDFDWNVTIFYCFVKHLIILISFLEFLKVNDMYANLWYYGI